MNCGPTCYHGEPIETVSLVDDAPPHRTALAATLRCAALGDASGSEAMSGLDIALIILLVLFTALGFYWGLIRQVLALAGLLVGVVLAGRYGPEVAGWLTSFTNNDMLASAGGFVAVLVGVSALASFLASLLRIFVGLLFLGWLDRLLGGVLGLVQAIVAGAALLVVAVTFPQPAWAEAVQASRLAGSLLRVGSVAALLLPETFRAAVQAVIS
jgi:membrane protein required for colicin V production